MEGVQDNEGACSRAEVESIHCANGTLATSTIDDSCGVDNTAEEQKKKKKTRRGKRSKGKESNDGNVNNVEQQNAEALDMLSISTQTQLENINHVVPDVNMALILDEVANSIIADNTAGNNQTEEAVTTKPSKSQKKKKGKKKYSKMDLSNSVQLSPLHSINNDTSIPSSYQAQMNQIPEVQNTPHQDNSKKKQNNMHKRSGSAPKEKTTFDDYLLPSEAMSALLQNMLISGVIRINQRNYKEAYINAPDKGQDILIEGMRNRNRALEGDEVLVKLNPQSEWREQGTQKQRTGKVVFIKEMVHPRVCVGFLKLMTDRNKDCALFSPRDSRVPRIKIPMAKCPDDFMKNEDKYKTVLFLAKIEDWKDVRNAVGTILERIGDIGELKSETMALLMENDIETQPYDIHLYQYFPRPPFVLPEEEINSRADLRNDCIFTIDPLTARDLDDAVSCKELENGNLLIGVHISDVSYFLKEGTPLDQAVAKRATSTYLVDAVHHMLPRELCLMCSLLPGEDKLAFSVFWEMTQEAEIVKHYFTRSIVNSCTQLAYEHAQVMLENPDKEWAKDELPRIYGKYKASDLSRVVNHLNRLAIIMRSKRFKDGALRIEQPKIMFNLESGTGNPIKYTLYVNKESHRLIEEFMLLANMTVASKLNTDFPDLAFLRCHPSPHEYVMEELKKSMEQIGIFLNVQSAGELQASLWRYAGSDFISQARMMVLNNLCAKPMARAKYFCASFQQDEKDYWHYALNVPLYTHFTSPIRRYADVMVHRLLSASLGYASRPDWQIDEVQKIAVNCNKQKYSAKRAGEQSVELYLAAYIDLQGPMIEEAIVMDVKDLSFDIIICSMGLNQRVYTNNMPDKIKATCRKDGNKIVAQEIEWLPSEGIPFGTLQVVEIFSILIVEVTRSKATHKIETRLLRPTSSHPITKQ